MIDLVTRGKLKFSNSEAIQQECWNSLWINVSIDTVKEPIFIQIGGGKNFFVLIWHGMTL